MKQETQTCVCCGLLVNHPEPDPWDGRMDEYCVDCAWSRCDAFPGECPVTHEETLVCERCGKELLPHLKGYEHLYEPPYLCWDCWRTQVPLTHEPKGRSEGV